MLSLQVMGQYDDVKITLGMCILHDAAKHECNNHDVVNRIEISLKTRRHTMPKSSFFLKDNTEGLAVCDVTLSVTEAMIIELTVHAASTVFGLNVQAVVVFHTNAFLDLVLVMWLYDPLRPCW